MNFYKKIFKIFFYLLFFQNMIIAHTDKIPAPKGALDANDQKLSLNKIVENNPLTYLTLYKDGAILRQINNFSLNSGSFYYTLSSVATTIQPETLMFSFNEGVQKTFIEEYTIEKNPQTSEVFIKLLINNLKSPIQAPLQMIYTFKNLEWQNHYSLFLDASYQKMSLNSWIVINNKTGMAFKKANFTFINDSLLNQGFDNLSNSSNDSKKDLSKNMKPASSYIYSRSLDLEKDSTKTINWISGEDIAVQQDYRLFVGGEFLDDMNSRIAHPKIETWITFKNSLNQNLGRLLPQGPVTLYWQTDKKEYKILGKTLLPATNIDQFVSFKVPSICSIETNHPLDASHSNLNNIETELDQTEFKKLSEKISEASYRLTIKNKTNQKITLKTTANFPESEWSIVRENINHQKNSDLEAFWIIQIEPNSEFELKYRIRLIRV